jgi:hypothetical protein
MEDLKIPTLDYYLDQSDPDVVIVRRQDGTFVAAFSARGATKEGILEAAKEDRRELIRTHANPLLGQEMVGFVFDTESRENEMEAPTKEGWSAHRGRRSAERCWSLCWYWLVLVWRTLPTPTRHTTLPARGRPSG